jgi:hypothetical protein
MALTDTSNDFEFQMVKLKQSLALAQEAATGAILAVKRLDVDSRTI